MGRGMRATRLWRELQQQGYTAVWKNLEKLCGDAGDDQPLFPSRKRGGSLTKTAGGASHRAPRRLGHIAGD